MRWSVFYVSADPTTEVTGTNTQTVTSPHGTQTSDVTTTTSGSLPSIPSSISQTSPARGTVLSPSSSGHQSVSEEISARLSGKRFSIEQVGVISAAVVRRSFKGSYIYATLVLKICYFNVLNLFIINSLPFEQFFVVDDTCFPLLCPCVHTRACVCASHAQAG